MLTFTTTEGKYLFIEHGIIDAVEEGQTPQQCVIYINGAAFRIKIVEGGSIDHVIAAVFGDRAAENGPDNPIWMAGYEQAAGNMHSWLGEQGYNDPDGALREIYQRLHAGEPGYDDAGRPVHTPPIEPTPAAENDSE